MAKGPGKYVVEFTAVGVHAGGDVVEFTKDHVEKLGVDIERLLGIGAIREATGDEAKTSVEYGDTDTGQNTAFPAVPFQAAPAAHQEVPQPKRPDEK